GYGFERIGLELRWRRGCRLQDSRSPHQPIVGLETDDGTDARVGRAVRWYRPVYPVCVLTPYNNDSQIFPNRSWAAETFFNGTMRNDPAGSAVNVMVTSRILPSLAMSTSSSSPTTADCISRFSSRPLASNRSPLMARISSRTLIPPFQAPVPRVTPVTMIRPSLVDVLKPRSGTCLPSL